MRATLLLAALVLAACATPQPDASAPVRTAALQTPSGPTSDDFGEYWYTGLAELGSYDLVQSRYGEPRAGTAVLIFVTEDFSRSKQVKTDRADADKVSVLKLNATRSFVTGIYPYSTMLSVFTPISRNVDPRTLKVTTSVQEWCGHVWMQLNHTGGGSYRALTRSYFESEGDTELPVEADLLEDEVWTAIRLNPADLPTGAMRALPGTLFQRLRHTAPGPEDATGALSAANADSLRTYTLTYPTLGRTLAIEFAADFPHEIAGWTETQAGQRGQGGEEVTTATLRERTRLAYWQHNAAEDEAMRASELGL